MEPLKERAKKDFIRNQQKINDKKTSKEERKELIKINQFILDLLKEKERGKRMKKRTFKNIKLYLKNYIINNKYGILLVIIFTTILYLGIIFTW